MIEVVVVTSPACHLCQDAKEALAELGGDYPLEVREVDVASAEGEGILERLRPPMQPAVLVNGRLFSSGRLPRKKLRKMLEKGFAP